MPRRTKYWVVMDMNGTGALVLSKLSDESQTVYEIATQVFVSPQTVSLYLRRALSNGRVIREPLPGEKRWVYGWRLRCGSCGR